MLFRSLPWLYCDARLVRQVLLNLISNAAKFTHAGGKIAISVGCDPDRRLRMSVADTGIGIAPEDLADALAPFRQVDNELGRLHDGTGLGLPLSKAFIELHDGSFRLDSEPGKGTTVTAHFPESRLGREAEIDLVSPREVAQSSGQSAGVERGLEPWA